MRLPEVFTKIFQTPWKRKNAWPGYETLSLHLCHTLSHTLSLIVCLYALILVVTDQNTLCQGAFKPFMGEGAAAFMRPKMHNFIETHLLTRVADFIQSLAREVQAVGMWDLGCESRATTLHVQYASTVPSHSLRLSHCASAPGQKCHFCSVMLPSLKSQFHCCSGGVRSRPVECTSQHWIGQFYA